MLLENLQLSLDDIPSLKDVEYQGHPKDYRDQRLISLMIFMLVLSAAWIIPLISYFTARVPAKVSLIIFGIWTLILIISLIAEIKGFMKRGYALREHDITYRKGYFFHSQTTVPFNRIQHSETSQGPFSRAFNIMSLKIFTAGGAASDLRIRGLRPEEAERLKDFITEIAAKHE